MKINLIASPRNLSTALMYAFHHRGDTLVIDEPFYGYYLKTEKVEHPGKQEILASMPTDYQQILKSFNEPVKHNHVFLKNMAHHHTGFGMGYATKFVNLFVIRDPKYAIASFTKVIPKPTLKDLGIQRQWELFQEASQGNMNPLVFDSSELLMNPTVNLKMICKLLQLPFTSKMTTWPPGAIEPDGIWARHWYQNVHNNTGFKPFSPHAVHLDTYHRRIYEKARRVYDLFTPYKIKLHASKIQ